MTPETPQIPESPMHSAAMPARIAPPLYRRAWFRVLYILIAIFALALVFPSTRRMLDATRRRIVWAAFSPKADITAGKKRIELLLEVQGMKPPLEAPRIAIDKSERRLDLYNADRLLKSYPIALGAFPEGPKREKGDGRTPEGNYFICTRRTKTPYHLFLGINYPSGHDARLAFREKRIEQAEATSIVQAEAERKTPPWNTTLGGAIGIHGRGAKRGDWTLGCIAMEDADVEEIWAATDIGAPVSIQY